MSKYVLLAQKCCSVLENCPGCHSFVSKNVWNCRHLSSKRKNCRTRWKRWKITWRFLVPKIPFWSMVAMGSCNRLNYPNMNENLSVNIPVCWHGFAWNQWNNCQDCKDIYLNFKYRHHNLSAHIYYAVVRLLFIPYVATSLQFVGLITRCVSKGGKVREKDNNTTPLMAPLVLSDTSSNRTNCKNACLVPILAEQGISETEYILNTFLQPLLLFFSSCSVFSSVLQNYVIEDNRLCTHWTQFSSKSSMWKETSNWKTGKPKLKCN